MTDRPAEVSTSRHLFTTLLFAMGCATGCVSQNQEGILANGQRSQAVLAAARSNDISLFGDLPGTGAVTYYTRSATSLRQHTFTDVGADFDADISPDGRQLVFASTRHHVRPDLYLKAVDGVAVTQLTADPGSDVQPAFSPDGSRIAFCSQRSGNWDIWMVDVNGGPPVQVTTSPADEIHPSWSPDGTQLVFCSLPAEGGQWELWITDATAGSRHWFIGYGLFPEWSPNGQYITYQRARERGSHWFGIWTMMIVDGEPRYPTEVSTSATQAMILPTWSKDGSQIAFVGTAAVPPRPVNGVPLTENQIFDIWVMNSDGRGRVRLTDGHTSNHAPVFSPNGRIFFTSNRSGHDNIWSLMPGVPEEVTADIATVTRNINCAAEANQGTDQEDDL